MSLNILNENQEIGYLSPALILAGAVHSDQEDCAIIRHNITQLG